MSRIEFNFFADYAFTGYSKRVIGPNFMIYLLIIPGL